MKQCVSKYKFVQYLFLYGNCRGRENVEKENKNKQLAKANSLL